MFCKYCGEHLDDDATFCTHCGKKIIENKHEIKMDGEKNTDKRKCPNCGAVLQSFVGQCSYCGTEVKNKNVSDAILHFSENINLNNKTNEIKSVFKEKTLTLSQKLSQQIGEIGRLVSEEDEKRNDAIRSYVIPNEREEILEFMIMAVSNIIPESFNKLNNGSDYRLIEKRRAESEAWIVKYEQASQKALLVFGRDDSFKQIDDLFHKKMKQIENEKKKYNTFWVKYFLGIVIFLIIMLVIAAVFGI